MAGSCRRDVAEGAYRGPINPGAAYGEERVAYWIHVCGRFGDLCTFK